MLDEYKDVFTILFDSQGREIKAYPLRDKIRRYSYRGIEYFHCVNLNVGKYWFCFKPHPAIGGTKRHMMAIIDNMLYNQGVA